MNRTEWLNGLKVGDRVLYIDSYDNKSVATVMSITPKRTKFEVDVGQDNDSMDRHGHARVSPYRSSRIEPLTDEAVAEIALRQRARKVTATLKYLRDHSDGHTFTTEKLDAVEPLLIQLKKAMGA